MSNVGSHHHHHHPFETDIDRPERSRNAKAQARHRAKRKAYIDELEQTVTKLQLELGYSVEQVNAIPPPMAKIRELEVENGHLKNVIRELQRQIPPGTHPCSHPLSPLDQHNNNNNMNVSHNEFSYSSYSSDPKTGSSRRLPIHIEDSFMNHASRPLTASSMGSEYKLPPPLHVPHPSSSSSSSASTDYRSLPSSSLGFSSFGTTNSPSGSSEASDSPFSQSITLHPQPPLHENNVTADRYSTVTAPNAAYTNDRQPPPPPNHQAHVPAYSTSSSSANVYPPVKADDSYATRYQRDPYPRSFGPRHYEPSVHASSSWQSYPSADPQQPQQPRVMDVRR